MIIETLFEFSVEIIFKIKEIQFMISKKIKKNQLLMNFPQAT